MSLAGHGRLTLPEIRDEARHVSCVCGAPEEQPCDCCSGGVHYARLSRACACGVISLADFADAIHDDVFSGGDVFAPQAQRRSGVAPEAPSPAAGATPPGGQRTEEAAAHLTSRNPASGGPTP